MVPLKTSSLEASLNEKHTNMSFALAKGPYVTKLINPGKNQSFGISILYDGCFDGDLLGVVFVVSLATVSPSSLSVRLDENTTKNIEASGNCTDAVSRTPVKMNMRQKKPHAQ